MSNGTVDRSAMALPGAAPARAACVVCDGPLPQRPSSHAAQDGFCDAPGCRIVRSRKGTMSPRDFDFWVALQARSVRARAAQAQADARLLAEKRRLEADENVAAWAAAEAQAALADQAPVVYERLVLPSGPRRLRNLPRARVREYRDHLTRVIAQAVSGVEPSIEEQFMPDDAGGSALGDTLCGVCGGGCCTYGGSTAYLSASTIRRFMAAHPQLRPRDVLAAYLDRLQPRTEAGSCVNHTAAGCGITREMRSDLCNRFLCQPLKNLRAMQREGRPVLNAVVVVRRQDQWHRDALDRPNGILRTEVVRAEAATAQVPLTRLPSRGSSP